MINSDTWTKSTFSGNGNCVEIKVADTGVLVRDSKNPTGGELAFTREEWDAFTAGVVDGQFDL